MRTEAQYLSIKLRHLRGKKIVAVVPVDIGFNGETWPGIHLDDGSVLLVQRDAEGNGGGWLKLIRADEVAARDSVKEDE